MRNCCDNVNEAYGEGVGYAAEYAAEVFRYREDDDRDGDADLHSNFCGELGNFLNQMLDMGYELVSITPIGPPSKGSVLCVMRLIHGPLTQSGEGADPDPAEKPDDPALPEPYPDPFADA